MIKFFNSQRTCLGARQGYTLIETLIYTAVFVAMSFIIVALILSVLETGRQVSPLNSLSREAVSSLEIMTREIRSAISVNATNSVLATSTGSLELNTLNDNGGPRTIRFYLASGTIKIDEDGIYLGPLSSDNVIVTALIFDLASSTGQNLIKIELDLVSGDGRYQRSEEFYSSVKLRAGN